MSNRPVYLFLRQTTPIQDFYLSQPIENVVGMGVTNLYMENVTSAGDALFLLCEQARSHDPNTQSQVSDTIGALYPAPLVWSNAYPLPTLSNQVELCPLRFETPRLFKNVTLSLKSDGALNVAGMTIGWIVTLFCQ